MKEGMIIYPDSREEDFAGPGARPSFIVGGSGLDFLMRRFRS